MKKYERDDFCPRYGTSVEEDDNCRFGVLGWTLSSAKKIKQVRRSNFRKLEAFQQMPHNNGNRPTATPLNFDIK